MIRTAKQSAHHVILFGLGPESARRLGAGSVDDDRPVSTIWRAPLSTDETL